MGDEELQQPSSSVERDQQEVCGKWKRRCNGILNLRLNLLALTEGDICSVIKQSDSKTSFKLVNRLLKEASKVTPKAVIVLDVGLFIFFLANFIHSLVNFAAKQEPLTYNIVSTLVSSISLSVNICKLVYTLRRAKKREDTYQAEQESNEENIKQETELNSDSIKFLKQLAIKLLHEFLLYPAIICSLYAFINEKSWEFEDALGGYNFCHFLYNTLMDAMYTKFLYIGLVLKVLVSLHFDANNAFKLNHKFWLIVTLNLIVLVLVHWLILAIIGIRIHVDNFAREIDQGSGSEAGLGGYKVASYTGYMLFCGAYLPVASVISHLVLNRTWLLEELDASEEIFHFLLDPISYIIVPFLMGPFIAFCIGSFLPDYDNSEFDIDPHAKVTAKVLGAFFIVFFILGNISATVAFGILLVVITIIVIIIAIIITIIILVIAAIVSFIGLLVAGSGEAFLMVVACFCCCQCLYSGTQE